MSTLYTVGPVGRRLPFCEVFVCGAKDTAEKQTDVSGRDPREGVRICAQVTALQTRRYGPNVIDGSRLTRTIDKRGRGCGVGASTARRLPHTSEGCALCAVLTLACCLLVDPAGFGDILPGVDLAMSHTAQCPPHGRHGWGC